MGVVGELPGDAAAPGNGVDGVEPRGVPGRRAAEDAVHPLRNRVDACFLGVCLDFDVRQSQIGEPSIQPDFPVIVLAKVRHFLEREFENGSNRRLKAVASEIVARVRKNILVDGFHAR